MGGNLLYVGCDNGTVHMLDESFQSQGALNAYGYKVLFMAWAQVCLTIHLLFAIHSSLQQVLQDTSISHCRPDGGLTVTAPAGLTAGKAAVGDSGP